MPDVPAATSTTTTSSNSNSKSFNNGSSSSQRRWDNSSNNNNNNNNNNMIRRPTSMMMMIPRQWTTRTTTTSTPRTSVTAFNTTNTTNTTNNKGGKNKSSRQRRNRSFVISLCCVFVVSIWTAWFFPTVRWIQQEQQQQQQQQAAAAMIRNNNNNNNNNPKNDDKNDKKKKKKICFVNSVYGNHAKGAAMDKATNVTLLQQQEPDYEFYYFTNLKELETPGWTKVVMEIPNVTRHITMSRWPKFLGWKYAPIVERCGLVVYLDGYWAPQKGKSLKYRLLSREIQDHDYGLLQITHHFGNGIRAEMERIVNGTKDTREHVDAALQWMESQPDFIDNCTLYWNGVFGTYCSIRCILYVLLIHHTACLQ
jgi:hypothetical protein